VRTSLIAFAALVALAGCGGGGEDHGGRDVTRVTLDERTATAPAAPKAHRPKRVPSAHCAPSAANCRAARGRVIYVEAVDPDGDGDAHFVLASRQSVTAPGITVIDVERSMRPRRLPGDGDEVSAAGPVYRGSHGQRQIQATELHVEHGR
jgi:hypothetical protein